MKPSGRLSMAVDQSSNGSDIRQILYRAIYLPTVLWKTQLSNWINCMINNVCILAPENNSLSLIHLLHNMTSSSAGISEYANCKTVDFA
jgi:hypothetical protein